MTLLSFSLNRDKIESGAKPHTIRFRKNPPRPGEDLFLWWKPRTQDRDLIGVSACQRVDKIVFKSQSVLINDRKLSAAGIKNLAIKDGFDSVDEFWNFFKGDQQQGFLIWWNPDHISQRRILPQVKNHGQCGSEIVSQPVDRYYPSNGTEGMYFEGLWCDRCRRREKCFVMMRAFLRGSTRHWIHHEGQPICTIFQSKEQAESSKFAAKQKRLEAIGQLSLFG